MSNRIFLDTLRTVFALRKFFKTVAIVTVFSVSEKFLGFLYRIFLSHTIGAEGIGLYQVALSVFGLIFTATCSGTPITVSRLMTKFKAENKPEKVKKIITAGLTLTVSVVIPVCIICFLLGNHLGFLFADERCINIFRAILPGLAFTSVYSVLRGVFWGNKDFLPYSIIELLEEICMIVSGVILISFASSVYDGAFRAGIAVLISYLFSFTLAVVVFIVRKNKLSNPKPLMRPLIQSATPITVMRTASTLTVSLVSIILPMRLVLSGYTNSQAMALFGSAMGQAIPLLFIPTTLIGSFTLVLVPEISENYYKKQYFYLKRDVEKAIKFACFLTCLFVPIFFVCGKEMGVLIFNSVQCGEFLKYSAFLMVFMSLSTITTSILNSMGLEKKTLIYYIISSVFMLLCIYFLPSVLGIYALLVGFTFVYGLTSLFNMKLLKKSCKQRPDYAKFIIFSTLIILPCTILGLMLEKLLVNHLGMLLTLLTCAVAMLTFSLALCVGFGLIKIDTILSKLKRNKKTTSIHSL